MIQLKKMAASFQFAAKYFFLRLFYPLMGIWILLISLACTIWAKAIVIQSQQSSFSVGQLTRVIFPDVLFFVSVWFFVETAFIVKPSFATFRSCLFLTLLIFVWSGLNAVWLVKNGVQLQPGVLLILLKDFKDIWPIVQAHLVVNFKLAAVPALLGLIAIVFLIWLLRYSPKINTTRSIRVRSLMIAGCLIIAILFGRVFIKEQPSRPYLFEALNFSSHWYGITSGITALWNHNTQKVITRNIPQKDQRQVALPKNSDNLPNIVLILLESISYPVTSLADPNLQTTPNLARLAVEGAEFIDTRCVISHTTKAWWATLTSTYPVIQQDYVEAVPVSVPYEGLSSILARAGYHSAFFQMSKGSFECTPAFFHNLAFDWAWFRENLEDPNSYLGYMGGDDCRMIEPAVKWAKQQSTPFFLMMTTAVSHDPYEVPQWFEKPQTAPYQKYLQTVRYTDYFIGQLLKTLKEKGLYENTIICILGDHGTSFKNQKGKGRWVPSEDVLKIPWIIRYPGKVNMGQKITLPCSQLDVTPTVLGLIGFDIKNAGFEGINALVATDSDRRFFFSSWYADSPIGYVEKNHKFIYWPCLDKVFEYDLSSDAQEENPRILAGKDEIYAKNQILQWQQKSQILIDAKRYDNRLLYSHWRIFSLGKFAWSYYVP